MRVIAHLRRLEQVGPRIALLMAAVLTPLVLAADRANNMSWSALSVDVTIGVALAVSGLVGRPAREGALVGLVGVAWLLGSLHPQAATLSRGALLLALVALPNGLVRARYGWWPYAVAVVVALPGSPQLVVGTAFGVCAWQLRRANSSRLPQPMAAALTSLTALSQFIGAASLGFNAPELAAVGRWGYQVALLGLAVGFPWGSRRAHRELTGAASRLRSTTAISVDDADTSIRRLGELLGAAVGDRDLELTVLTPGLTSGLASGLTHTEVHLTHSLSQSRAFRRLDVMDAGTAVAVVTSTSSALDDPDTARAVSESVRLILRNQALLEQERARLDEVAAARARLVDAEDRERAALAALVHSEVVTPVQEVATELTRLRDSITNGPTREALDLVIAELLEAVADTRNLLAGRPPFELGEGRLVDAIDQLAARSPLPMSVSIAIDVMGDNAAETTLYAVCAEALTNTLKHAHATSLSCRLTRNGAELVATVTDDGVGGADPHGSGLQGLSDRLAARGGSLQVVSPDGAGTCLQARVPASAQSIFS